MQKIQIWHSEGILYIVFHSLNLTSRHLSTLTARTHFVFESAAFSGRLVGALVRHLSETVDFRHFWDLVLFCCVFLSLLFSKKGMERPGSVGVATRGHVTAKFGTVPIFQLYAVPQKKNWPSRKK